MSVTAAAGFRASGVAAGLKSSGAPDVALVVNDGPSATAAAVFTSNRIKAAPVMWSQQCIATGQSRAVVLNSGGANACTGPEGFADTHHTAEHVASIVGVGPIDVLVCSTGLIGERLPMPRLLTGIDVAHAALSVDGGADAARAIMTTDSVPKTAVASAHGITVGGMAKGAGMLAPGLATMLVVLTTDAEATSNDLDEALRSATQATFDLLDSDGCMSTNDTVILMASGASGVTPSLPVLSSLVRDVCGDLARQLMSDAEGSSKDITITVTSAASIDEAVTVARAVSRSNLFKCAITGEDPNWGRVLAAVGTTDAVYEPDEIDVAINGVWVCRNGSVGDSRDLVDMSGRAVEVAIDLRAGDCEASLLTNDLTAAYVHENSAYST
ncbi:MAG: bifunctional glutamate N-acetyltransferase/amino-acid acetyltransferase ArgJ [Actinobacteria bacterium]|nr:bifunctional glutamate N-acetyltransferase/amino-acid acetyltransferase ArgJ [Actinomycetota bacterium]